MTPDERLREAVGRYLDAVYGEEWGHASEALANLRAVYNEDPRPCINAAVKVEEDWSWYGWFRRWRKKQ